MKTSFVVMADPRRRRRALALAEEMEGAPIAWAAPPWATKDDWGPVWRTRRAALLMHTDAPFHCVVQDDVVLARDFLYRVDRMVEAGDFLYMLFFRKKRNWPEANKAADVRRDFIFANGPLLGPGLVFPTHWIADLIEFCDELDPRWGDDDRMRRWLRARGLSTYIPIPSLVDHAPNGSLIGNGNNRQAWRFRR